MMEKVIFLGTSAGIPTNARNVASLAITFNGNSGDFWLFDCGEGTQQQIQRAGLKLSKLKNIFISHLHGDHLFGLPGLLATRGLQGITKSINIFGPVGLENYLKNCFDYSSTHIPYKYHIYSIEKENFLTKKLLWKKENCSVFCAILNHQIDSFGYAIFEEKMKRNIIVEKLIRLGVQPGPIYRSIKEKTLITLEDGRILKRDDFVKESVHIKKICYCSDTMFCENAVILARDADLLIHEATFSNQEKTEAEQSFHSTIEDAIKVARSAKVKRLVLNHISPRYQYSVKGSQKWDTFRGEATGQYPEIILAEDFLEIKI
jgi:ribonuclease Z